MTFRITGIPDVEQALSEVARQSTRTAITRRALSRAARPMLELAKRYAPIDQGDLEAALKISTRVRGEAGRAAYSASMRAAATSAKALGVAFDRDAAKSQAVTAMRDARRAFRAENPAVNLYLGPTQDIWYAHFVEFGTKSHIAGGQFKGSRHPGTAPDPFLRPAFDAEARGTIERLKPLLWDEIRKNAARMAKRAARG